MASKSLFYGIMVQCFLYSMIWASDGNAQSGTLDKTYIRIKQKETTVKQLLSEVEKNTNFHFVYIKDLLDDDVITLDIMGRLSLSELLMQVSKKTQLKFKQVNNTIYLGQKDTNMDEMVSLNELHQSRTVTGRVISQDATDGLPGVNVIEKNTSNGTVTDLDGRYSLQVSEGAVLVFSFVGYTSEEVSVGNRSEVNITLVSDIRALQEIIVVGYGTVKKSDLTGSVSSVKAEELTAFPSLGAIQALQGRAAGLQITANNGEPGASHKIRIRGGTSINASSDPLIVVDGFVGAAMPPPEDIQSIEVLKDASATAIYGSRGANGIIMITTKRGRTGQTRIEFNSSYSLQNEINRLDLLDADQFISYIQEARPNIGPAGGNTDWQDQIFRTGNIQNYQLSLSGGNEAVNYYVSGTYFDQEGVIVNSAYNRFSLTSNLDIKATDRFNVGVNLFAQRNIRDGVRTQEGSGGLTPGVVSSAFKFEPDQPIYRPDGTFTIARLHDPIDNPYAIATQLQDEEVYDRFQGSVFAEYEIINSLKFRTTFGATTNSGRRGRYSPTTLQEGRNVGGGDARVDGSKSTLFLNENYLTYDRTFGQIHNFTAMAGYSYQSSVSENWGGRSQAFITDAISYWGLGSAAVYQAPTSSLVDWRISSYYGRLNYSLLDRYLITFTARYDGSSNFSANEKWAFFPSGAIGWNMKNEPFLQDVNALSFWKWRVSYGLTGNQAISPYETLARFSPVFSVIGGNIVNAARPTTVANENLTWETTAQLNVGADIGFLDDRITLTLDAYRMVTDDLLFSVQLPSYSGYTNQIRNIGKVENKGIEAMVSSRNLTGAFQWNMDVNISANRNKVLALPGGNDIQYGSGPGHMVGLGNTQILREGHPVGTFFGWIYDGVYQTGDTFIPGGGFEQVAGGEKFRDISGPNGEADGVLNNNDRAIIGNPHPKFIWGWNNDFRLGNFDLNMFFQGSQGNDLLSYTLMELDLLAGNNNATTNALRRWTPENTNTDVPKAALGRTRRVSTRWIYDGSYVRLKNLSLGYNLPAGMLGRANMTRLRIYVSAQNILTLTDYPGYDPEVNYNTGGNTNGNRNLGLDYGSYPNAKSYTLGINVGF